MENLVFSLNATMPVFIMIAIGWILKKIRVIDENFIKVNNKFAFSVLFPILLFRDISEMDIYEEFSLKFVLFCFLGTMICFAAVWAAAKIFIKDRRAIGSFVVCSCRGSAAVLGVVFAQNIYGSSGMVPMMIIASVPLYNIFSVILMTVYSFDGDKRLDIKKVLKGIITNPLILGILAGIPFALLRVEFPVIVQKVLDYSASMTSPLALLVVGAEFTFSAAKSKINLAVWASVIKLVILQVLFLPIAVWMGFRGADIVAIIIMLGSPTTVASYIMAKNMKSDPELASSIVVITTMFSAVTVTASVFIMKTAGII